MKYPHSSVPPLTLNIMPYPVCVRADEKMQLELAIDFPFCIAAQLVRLLKGKKTMYDILEWSNEICFLVLTARWVGNWFGRKRTAMDTGRWVIVYSHCCRLCNEARKGEDRFFFSWITYLHKKSVNSRGRGARYNMFLVSPDNKTLWIIGEYLHVRLLQSLVKCWHLTAFLRLPFSGRCKGDRRLER